jgi:hypothetical protein
LIAEIEVLAHFLIVRFPGKLHVSATIVGIYIGLAVAALNPNGVPIRLTLSFVELLDWLPRVGAFVLGRGQHVSGPTQVTYIFVLL